MAENSAPLLQCEAGLQRQETPEERRSERRAKDLDLAWFAGSVLAMLDANDMGIIAFLPEYFKVVRRLTPEKFGVATGFSALGILVVAPAVPPLMVYFGSPAKTCLFGLVIYIISRLLFLPATFIPLSDADTYFHVISMVFAFSGFAYAFVEIGVAAWVLAASHDSNRTQALAIMVQGRTVGSLMGPIIFGSAYGLGTKLVDDNTAGTVPFAVGTCLVAFAVYRVRTRSTKAVFDRQRTQDSLGYKSGVIVARLPVVLAYILQGVCLGQPRYFLSVFQPTLLWKYGIGPTELGVCMTLTLALLVYSTMKTPALEQRFGPIGSMTLGSLCCAVALLGYGPSPLVASYLPVPSPYSQWLPIGTLMLSVVTIAPATVSLPSMVMAWSTRMGVTSNDAAAQVAMLNILFGSSFTCLAPFIAGEVAARYDLSTSLTCGTFGVLILNLVLLAGMKLFQPKETRSAVQIAAADAI